MRWLRKLGEALVKMEEASNLSYVHYAQDTIREGAKEKYNSFCKKISPKIAQAEELARTTVLSHFGKENLPKELLFYVDLAIKQRALYQEGNLDLLGQEAIIGNKFNEISAVLKVMFNGERQELSKVVAQFPGAERAEREKIWRAVWSARLKKTDQFHVLIDRLIPLRLKIKQCAAPQGSVDDYFYTRLQSDFTANQVKKLCSAVENIVVPFTRGVYEQLATSLGVKKLKPWDVTPTRYFELLPIPHNIPSFSSPKELLHDTISILDSLSPKLSRLFRRELQRGSLDIFPRTGKATNAFASTASSTKRVFMLAHTRTAPESFGTLVHEFGHVVHDTLSLTQDFGPNRVTNRSLETCELAAIGLELLVAAEILTNKKWCHSSLHREVARQMLLHNVLFSPYMAQLISFQSWLYKNPNQSHHQREATWITLDKKFAPKLDWQGLEEIRGMQWQQQAHVFKDPFYYPQYSIAQFGALELFSQYVSATPVGRQKVVARFFKGLSLGGSTSGRHVYETIGVSYLPSESKIAKSLNTIASYL